MRLATVLWAIVLGACLTTQANAQSGGGYELTWSSVDGGGADSAGGDFRLLSSAGQPDALGLSAGGYELDGGLWPGVCSGAILEYGTACAGLGGFAPRLRATGCPSNSNGMTIEIRDAPGGASALLMLGLSRTSSQFGNGCFFLLGTRLPDQAFLTLSGSGPGDGNITLPFTVGSTVPMEPAALTMQAFVEDSSHPGGFTTTNGVELKFQ